jgi:hypothetical protein
MSSSCSYSLYYIILYYSKMFTYYTNNCSVFYSFNSSASSKISIQYTSNYFSYY